LSHICVKQEWLHMQNYEDKEICMNAVLRIIFDSNQTNSSQSMENAYNLFSEFDNNSTLIIFIAYDDGICWIHERKRRTWNISFDCWLWVK